LINISSFLSSTFSDPLVFMRVMVRQNLEQGAEEKKGKALTSAKPEKMQVVIRESLDGKDRKLGHARQVSIANAAKPAASRRRRPPPPPPDRLFDEVYVPTRRRNERRGGKPNRHHPFDELSAPAPSESDPEFPIFKHFPAFPLTLLPPEENAPIARFIADEKERRRHRNRKFKEQKLWKAKRRRKQQLKAKEAHHEHDHHHHDHHHHAMPDTIRKLLPSSARVVGVARPHPRRQHLDPKGGRRPHVMTLDDFLHHFPPHTHDDHELVPVEVGSEHAKMIQGMAATGNHAHHDHHHRHHHEDNPLFNELEELIHGRAPRRIPNRRNRRRKQTKASMARPRGGTPSPRFVKDELNDVDASKGFAPGELEFGFIPVTTSATTPATSSSPEEKTEDAFFFTTTEVTPAANENNNVTKSPSAFELLKSSIFDMRNLFYIPSEEKTTSSTTTTTTTTWRPWARRPTPPPHFKGSFFLPK